MNTRIFGVAVFALFVSDSTQAHEPVTCARSETVYRVANVLVGPDEPLFARFQLQVNVLADY